MDISNEYDGRHTPRSLVLASRTTSVDPDGDVDSVVGVDEDVADNDYVSDAEALLACWSFLRWRKRLGSLTTPDGPSSGSSSSLSLAVSVAGADTGDHRPNEIKEQRRKRRPSLMSERRNNNYFLLEGEELHHDTGESVTDGDDIDGDIHNGSRMKSKWEFEISSLVNSQGGDTSIDGDDGDEGNNDDETNVFTSFPSKPSDSTLRRSRALKRVWDDPDYRDRWYQRRWGSKPRRTKDQSLRERTAERRARALPPGFLGSEELASLTEEEIAQAIQTRFQSTRQRVAKRKQTLRERKEQLARQGEAMMQTLSIADNEEEEEQLALSSTSPRLARDVLFTLTREQLEAKQIERSDRAKRLYSTRLKNQKRVKEMAKKKLASSKGPYKKTTRTAAQVRADAAASRPLFPPKHMSPRDAFLRAEHQLDVGQQPTVQDIRLILQPTAMRQRKDLLRRILDEVFDVRGKCVPIQQRGPNRGSDDNNDDDVIAMDSADKTTTQTRRYEFVTHAKIADLGDLVITLLQSNKDDDEA